MENQQLVLKGGTEAPFSVLKNWGDEYTYGIGKAVAIKRLTVRPYAALSRQVHMRKDELYLVLQGKGRLEFGRHGHLVHELTEGDVVHVPPGTIHRLVAGSEGIVIIEASTSEVTDIIRLEDLYDREVNTDFDPVTYERLLRA